MKTIKFLFGLALCFAMTACGGGSSSSTDESSANNASSSAEGEFVTDTPDTEAEDPEEATDETSENQTQTAMDKENKQGTLVKFTTSMGDITVRLFDDTPKHRDNFLKLVREGYYNGVLFHRVINDFMVQTGDPDSKNAPKGKMLGSGGPGYTMPAEIVYPKHFHKRGALAAARTGDQMNPERRSSGSQFYIVTGQTYDAAQLEQMEQQLVMMQKQGVFNQLVGQHRDEIMAMQAANDNAGLQSLQDQLIAQMEAEVAKNPASFTPEMRKAYTTVGGTPHLDNQYTVFGEVVSGMDVVDKIQKVATDRNDRPNDDVKIISAEIL